MARKDKPGIKYFSQDSDHVLNKKIKLLFSEFDSHGPWVYECLKCEIYSKKGYYFDLNDADELMIFASDVCKKPVSLVKEIISGCLRRDLFDSQVYHSFKVLTSDRIQSNYLDATREKRKKSGEIDLIQEYWIIEIGPNEKAIQLKSRFSREKPVFTREEVHKGEETRPDETRTKERYTRDEVFENTVLQFFGFSSFPHHHPQARLIHECCSAQFYCGQLDFFKKQFGDYGQYIELIGKKYKYSFYNFLGKQANRFEDGQWNAENWELKLNEEKGHGKSAARGIGAVVEGFGHISRRQKHE